MIWKRSKTNQEIQNREYRSKKSEEINDIVEKMPMSFGRWVAAFIFFFFILLMLFGWLIKYPDTVTGVIKINSDVTPVKLVANAPGNIHILKIANKGIVDKGEYIAVIHNSADTEDVKLVSNLIKRFDPNKDYFRGDLNTFPEKISLGDLNLKYYTFLSALKSRCEYEVENIFEKQRIGLTDDIQWRKELLSKTKELLSTTDEKIEISQKWLSRYSDLNRNDVVTHEYEVDRSKNDYLATKQENQSLKKEVVQINMYIADNQNKLSQLSVEQKEKERKLQLDLLVAYQDLNDNIKSWEQKYVSKAPFIGKVEFLKFLSENQFIQTGEELFGIIPKEEKIFGQMLLPARGAGKVKVGSKTSIKLDNYPYMEYGSVEGIVSSISLLTQTQKSEQSTINTYLIIIELPNGLTTNYGETLNFGFEIGGTADIIVRDRRLIERLFDNLKYRTK